VWSHPSLRVSSYGKIMGGADVEISGHGELWGG
jgi:hypothetical protein